MDFGAGRFHLTQSVPPALSLPVAYIPTVLCSFHALPVLAEKGPY